MRAADSFDSAMDFLDDRLRTALLGVDSRVKESAYEIRLRAARPVVIVTRVGSLFVYKAAEPARSIRRVRLRQPLRSFRRAFRACAAIPFIRIPPLRRVDL